MSEPKLQFKQLLPVDIDKPIEHYAAVSMLINFVGDKPFLVVTRRSTTVRSHKGQISLPGGKGEPSDPSVLATALRETNEELGVKTDDFKILGRLQEFKSISGLQVIPFVMTCRDLHIDPMKLDHKEVAAVFQIPYQDIIVGKAQRLEFIAFGKRRETIFYESSEVRIWGLTAQIISRAEPTLF